MMIYRTLKYRLCGAVLLVVCGTTAGWTQKPLRLVRGAELISSDLPALRIRMDSAFQFVGTLRFRIRDVADGERFIFVDAENRRVRRMVIAQFEAILPTSSERYNYSFANADTIAGLKFRINPFAFSQAAASAENPEGEAALTAAFLKQQGFHIGDELMSIRFVTVPDSARRHELIIFYIEPVAGVRIADFYAADGTATALWRSLSQALATRAWSALQLL